MYSTLFAQSQVSGKIEDKETAETLVGVTISVVSVKDTTQRFYTSSNDDGTFKLGVPAKGYYKIETQSIGYNNFSKIYRINDGINQIGVIGMQNNPKILEQVNIRDNALGVEQYGDTTAYRASNFKTNPDATAEDLIKKMPGIMVDGSDVKAQGESVQRVLVDGREFFGDDPSATLKNLPADVVDKIEVFDRLSDQSRYTGIDDGNTDKTINIVTKPENRNGQFGRFYGGAGTDDRYSLGGNWNYFNDDQRLSILGQSNNINNQNFTSEDLVGVASSGSHGHGRGGYRGGGSRGGGGSIGEFLGQESGGINEVNSIGANYSDELGKKLQLTGSYFYNTRDTKEQQDLEREYILGADNSQYYSENSFSHRNSRNHRASLRLEYTPNDKDLIIFSPRLSFQNSTSNTGSMSETLNNDKTLLNQNDQTNRLKASGYSINNNLLYRHQFEKRGRAISLNIQTNQLDNTSETWQESITNYANQEMADSLQQHADNDTKSSGVSGNLTFTEGIGDMSQLQLSQEISYSHNSSDKETFDVNNEETEVFNPDYSNIFESNYLTSSSTLGYSYRNESGLFLRASVAYEYARLNNDQEYPENDQFARSFRNVLPGLFGRWRFSENSNLRFFYRTNTDAPSVTQLQNVLDNSNPLFLTIGNPNLKTSYSQRLALRYSKTFVKSAQSLFAFFNFSSTSNYISNETIIAGQEDVEVDGIIIKSGGQLSRPVNLDGYWNINSLITYGLPVKFIKSNLNVSAGVTVSRQPGRINDQTNYSNTVTANTALSISSNISENLDFNLSYNGDYSQVENSQRSELNDQYATHKLGLDLSWIFGGGWVLRQNISENAYVGLADGFNQYFTLWNASVGRKFLKNDKGELSLSVFDILNQNQQVNRTVTENYIEDVNALILNRYVMLNFTYRLRDFVTSSPPPDNHRPPWRMDRH